jgi:hypothetical protein
MSDQLWFSIMITNTVLIFPLVDAPTAVGVRMADGVAVTVWAVPWFGTTVDACRFFCAVGVAPADRTVWVFAADRIGLTLPVLAQLTSSNNPLPRMIHLADNLKIFLVDHFKMLIFSFLNQININDYMPITSYAISLGIRVCLIYLQLCAYCTVSSLPKASNCHPNPASHNRLVQSQISPSDELTSTQSFITSSTSQNQNAIAS